MKRIISVIITFAMILSLFPSMVVTADDTITNKIVYSENFDSCIFDLPGGFKPMTFAIPRCWVQKEHAVSGKALYVEDDSTIETLILYGPEFEVKPGEFYTAQAQMYVPYGTVSLYLKFYDSSDTQILSQYTAVGVNSDFSTVTAVDKAPANAVTGRICYSAGTTYMCKAYYDDVVVYEGKLKTNDGIVLDPPVQNDPVNAKIVEPDGDKLKYNTYNEQGDKLGDFSHVGFYKGEFEIPDSKNLPVAATIEPSEDPNADDTERIQKVINEVYDQSINDDFKVIKIKAGRYNINRTGISLKPGIVLSGEGQGPTGTILYATDPVVHNVVTAVGGTQAKTSEDVNIIDNYVKAGSNQFTVEKGKGSTFKEGDLIHIHHHGTEDWSKAMGMWEVTNYAGALTYWRDGAFNVDMDRTVTKVEGDTITVDFAFFVPMDNTHSVPYVYKTSEAAKWKHIGVENLRVESYYNGIPTDDNHAENGIWFAGVIDSYIRDVSVKHFRMAGIWVDRSTSRVTVKNCSSLDPISTIEGNRRYGFRTSGYQQLVSGCYSYAGRHDFNTTGNCPGPVVFNDCVVDTSSQASENHGFFAHSTLYDGVYFIANQHSGYLASTNRGYWGDGQSHGWSGASTVAWNCLSPAIIMNKPPMTYENFMVGIWGWYDDKLAADKKQYHIDTSKEIYRTSEQMAPTPENFLDPENSSFAGDCYMESPTAPVEPRSLYKAQLAERLTGNFKNVKPNSPVVASPRGDDVLDTNDVSIKGMFEKGAGKVTLYIDNEAYDAKLNNTDYTFELNLKLDDGVHKIYATQTIDGIESTKNADRFIIVNEENGNKDYLESPYEFDKIHPLINSDIISYDKYQNEHSSETSDKISVMVNRNLLIGDVDPVNIDGRVLVPIRAIFEALESEVTYNEATQTAISNRKDGTVIKITADSKKAYVNEREVELDVPATVINGRILVPVRFVAENLSADVTWNDNRQMVVIEGGIMTYPPIHNLSNELGVFKAIQSGDDGAGRTISYLFDGATTNWAVSAENPNGAYGIFDFGSPKKIKDMHLDFYAGDQRVYTFDIFVSDDKENWTMVSEKVDSSGTTVGFEIFPVNASGRYLKIEGKGNNLNVWNSYREIAFTEDK